MRNRFVIDERERMKCFFFFLSLTFSSLLDIPHFPTYSLSARAGILFSIPYHSPSASSSSSSESRMVGIVLSEMGLDSAESCFLTQILTTLQLFSTSIHLFPSSSCADLLSKEKAGESAQASEKRKRDEVGAESYVLFNDLFPFLALTPLPHGGRVSRDDTSYLHQQSLLRSSSIVSPASAKHISSLLKKEPAVESTCAFSIGPMYPSGWHLVFFRVFPNNADRVYLPQMRRSPCLN